MQLLISDFKLILALVQIELKRCEAEMKLCDEELDTTLEEIKAFETKEVVAGSKKLNSKRAVLIICETISDATEIHNAKICAEGFNPCV